VSEPLSSSLTAEVIVLINVFTVDSANQQRLVDILTNGGPKLAITDRA